MQIVAAAGVPAPQQEWPDLHSEHGGNSFGERMDETDWPKVFRLRAVLGRLWKQARSVSRQTGGTFPSPCLARCSVELECFQEGKYPWDVRGRGYLLDFLIFQPSCPPVEFSI